jgi:hypothetical protein
MSGRMNTRLMETALPPPGFIICGLSGTPLGADGTKSASSILGVHFRVEQVPGINKTGVHLSREVNDVVASGMWLELKVA